MKELTQAEWHRLLTLFVADAEDMRIALMKPFEQDGYVCATNANIILRVDKKFISEDFSTGKQLPDVASVMPEHNPISAITMDTLKGEFVRQQIDYDTTTVDCPYCDDECEVEWEYTDHDGDTHKMWAECPCCGGTGILPNGINKKCQVIGATINAHYMLLIYHVMLALGIDKAELTRGEREQILFHIAEGIDVVVMPYQTTQPNK